jgi:hypothetical protein
MNLRFRTFLGSADLLTFADLKVKTPPIQKYRLKMLYVARKTNSAGQSAAELQVV